MRMDNRRRRRRSGRARRNMPQRDNENGSDAHVAAGRRAGEDEDEDEKVELPMPGSFDFEDTTAVLHVRVSSIHSMRSACSGTCGGAHAGEMMVRARNPFRSFRISSHLELMYFYCYSYWFYRFPLVSV